MRRRRMRRKRRRRRRTGERLLDLLVDCV